MAGIIFRGLLGDAGAGSVLTNGLRLDADATTLPVVAAGTAVTAWPDASPYNNDGSGSATAATYQPTGLNGFASVRTTGTSAFTFPRPIETNWTIYLVLTTSGAGSGTDAEQWYKGAPLLESDIALTNSDWGVTMKASGHVSAGVGSPDTSVTATSGVVNDGTPHIICVTRDATSGVMSLYVDTVAVGSATLTTGTKSAPTITSIGNAGATRTPLVADYGRILAYSVTHGTAARASVHAALQAQFGL